MNIQLL